MPTSQPAVSIVIPVYNDHNCVARALRSALGQSCTDIEVIVVDDGSTDGSLDVVAEFVDERLRIFKIAHRGVSAARNFGISKASGQWCLLLDADDTLAPHCVECLLGAAEDTGTIVAGDFLVAATEQVAERYHRHLYIGRLTGDRKYRMLLYNRIFLRAGSFIVPTRVAREEPYDEELSRYEDVDAVCRWLQRVDLMVIDSITTTYNVAGGTHGGANDARYAEDFGFRLPIGKHRFWHNCFLGLILHYTMLAYPHRRKTLCERYGRYMLYAPMAWILRVHERVYQGILRMIDNR